MLPHVTTPLKLSGIQISQIQRAASGRRSELCCIHLERWDINSTLLSTQQHFRQLLVLVAVGSMLRKDFHLSILVHGSVSKERSRRWVRMAGNSIQ